MSRFIAYAIMVAAVGIGVTEGWATAFWFCVTIGLLLFVVYTVVDLVSALGDWLNRRREITVHLYDQEREDIIDAEVISETEKRKWWEV